MPGTFILDAHGQPVPEPDPETWGRWFATADRVVAQDRRTLADGPEVVVSTVFLGVNHRFIGEGAPILWETMLFWTGHEGDHSAERYTSRDAAETGHRRWVAEVFAELDGAAETLAQFTARVDRLLAEVTARAEGDDGDDGPDSDEAR